MKVLILSLSLLLFACGKPKEELHSFRGHLMINDSLTVRFVLRYDTSTSIYSVHNQNETIDQLIHSKVGDSIDLEHPVYNSHLRFIHRNDSLLGYWYDEERGNYKMSFYAKRDKAPFDGRLGTEDPTGVWDTRFLDPRGDEIGVTLLEWNNELLKGTILTETGDYRFLTGTVQDHSLSLSTFDFAHAYLFTAELRGDSMSNGVFYSGYHWSQAWQAKRDDEAALPKASSQVQIIDSLSDQFYFTGLSGEKISIDYPLFKDKAILVQLYGSWCPNCYDESRFLNDLYTSGEYSEVSFIGVAFERMNSFSEARKKIEKFRTGLAIKYPLAWGGYASKDTAQAHFPGLQKVMAFPTLLFYNKAHELVGVHSGFNGPGTGKYYLLSQEEIREMLELIQE